MTDIERVDDYLAKAKTFYLTTVDGTRPKCRPMGFHMVSGDRLYMGMGDHKDVYKQMQANPYVEICATLDGGFLRYYGKAVFETTDAIADRVMAGAPPLKKMYDENGWHMAIFHLEDATAEFRSMFAVEEALHF